MNPDILIAVGVAAVGALAGRFLITKDTAVEDRRRHAAKVAGELRAKGLSHIPDFLQDYAVGDYSGMASRIKALGVLASTGDGLNVELEKAFDSMLKSKLQEPDARDTLLKRIGVLTNSNSTKATS